MEITIKIRFNDLGKNSAPVKLTPVEWTLKIGKGEVSLPTITLTNDSGDLIIPNVDIDGPSIFHYKLDKFEKDIPIALSYTVKSSKLFALAQNLRITDESAVILPSEPIDATDVPKRVAIINEDRDWLAYESIFNRVRNRKSNKKFQMNLYILKRKDVCVWFRDDLDKITLENLTAAFFPDYESKDHLIYSNHIWEWKKLEEMGEEFTPLTGRLVACGKQYRVNLDSFVVLPYNCYDNGSSSRALGTKKLNDSAHQLDESLKWGFWKTASRSSVVRVERIKDKGAAWITVTKPLDTEWSWDYTVGEPERTSDDYSDKDFLLNKPLDPTGWKLSECINSGGKIDVSLKTGVIFVGSEQQSGSGKKDFLDENWIVACLRSDYVVAVNKELEAKGVDVKKDEKLIVLTELLSITEKTPRDVEVQMEKFTPDRKVVIEVTKAKVNDGIQVRDLSPLDKSKIYLAPLNIPHIDIDLKEFKDEFGCFGDEKWREFWRKHWAISLGRAKALFLLRYGLQHINPNPQNYLIEFTKKAENPKPTGRIIIRDLQDAAIHREVVWALYGKTIDLPLQGESNRIILKDVFQPVIKYEFEKVPDKSQETGTIDKTQNFGPPGTQFLWQRFSAFGSAAKLESVKSHRVAGRWQLFLTTMAKWGKSHNRSYVRCIEHQLGVNLIKIDWHSIPKPERYSDENLEYENVGKLCMSYDSDISSGETGSPPIITNVVGGNFPGLVRLAAETTSKQENLEEMFEAKEYSDKFEEIKGKLCLIANGSNFNNPKAKIGEIDVETILITKDKARIYFGVDAGVKTVFERKLLPLIVTNEDGGTVIYQFKAKSETDMGWEEQAAGKVHDYLKSKEGQRAIRKYKERGWKPVPPKFCIRVLDADENPLEEFPIKLKRGETRWNDITDGKGKIQIYEYLPDECQISFPPEFCLRFLDVDKKPKKELRLKFKRGDYETQWDETTDENGEVRIYQYSPDECQINFPDYDDVYIEVSQIKSWKEMIIDRRGGFVATVQFADYEDVYVEVSGLEKKEMQIKLHGKFVATVQVV